MEEIATIKELYDVFGGPAAIAEFLGVSRSAPGNWASEKKLPAHHLPAIQMRLAEEGKQASLSLFRLTRKRPDPTQPERAAQ